MWKTVVQNLLYFMHEVIPGAYSHGNWTKEGVDRAISWASYCEKIVKKPFQHGTLRDTFHELAEKYDWIISYHQLQNSQLYLFKFLIQNQLIDKVIKDYILERASEALGLSMVENLKAEARQQAEYHRQLIGLYDKKEKRFLRLQTKLLLEVANGFSKEELSIQLERIITQPFGLELLVDSLMSQNSSICSSTILVLNWLENIMRSEDTSHYACVLLQLIKLSSRHLCELLKYHQPLKSLVLSAMNREAKKLKLCYGVENCSWVTPETSRCILKYDDIIKICATLLSDPGISFYMKNKLLEWCFEDGGMVWNDIIKEVDL